MIVLALDSTTPAGSVALRLADGVVEARLGNPERGWSQRLPADLTDLLAASHVRLQDVDVFAVATGPGSLTGLRVGIATIQGLAFATGKRVSAISALDALAEHGADLAPDAADTRIGVWTNALRGEVFSGLYARAEPGASDNPLEPLLPAAVSAPIDAARAWAEVLGLRPLLVVGDVEEELVGPLRETFADRLTLRGRPLLARTLVNVAERQARHGMLIAPHAVRPVYVRQPDAVLARERAQRIGAGVADASHS